MLWKRLRVAVGVALIAALTAATPVLGTAVGSGGPWSYTSGGFTIKYSGVHNASLNYAYAETFDYNGLCGDLAVRLKYNPGSVDTGWYYTTTGPSSVTLFANQSGTTAASSMHRAENPLNGFWSPAGLPHAW